MSDVLEIIGPAGQVVFHDLDPAAGFTNIGRHPENDVVLDSPDVALFHAILDHRQKPYQLILLSGDGEATLEGRDLPPNHSTAVNYGDTVRLNGHVLMLLPEMGAAPPAARPVVPAPPAAEGIGASPPGEAEAFGPRVVAQPQPPASPPPPRSDPAGPAPDALDEALRRLDQLDALPEDQTDDVILVEHTALAFALDSSQQSSLDFNVNVEESATFETTLTNGGDIVAAFEVSVLGLDPAWVTITPPRVNLREGERATVLVSLTPPRLPTSRAGANFFSVVVTSPDHPGRRSATGGMLAINPYYDFGVGEPVPKTQTIPWSRRSGQATLSITNRGNGEAAFRLEGEDDERGCQFEFQTPDRTQNLARQMEVRVPSDEARSVAVNIHVLRRQFFGLLKHGYAYTLTATPLAGQQAPRSVAGQVYSAPLVGPWHAALLVILLLGLTVLVFRPTIGEFTVTPAELTAGQSATMSWRASPFVRLRIDPDVGAVNGPEGSKTITPVTNITYRLVAENFLSLLLPNWFGTAREVAVTVDPVLPTFELFVVDKAEVVVGNPVTVSWQVTNADELTLLVNGVPETVPPEQHAGHKTFFPDRDTTFQLVALNRYTPPDGVTVNVAVKVVGPPPVPLPPPVILRFDAQPSEITAGETVRLEWSVTGVDKVTIAPLSGDFPPSGSIVQSPGQTTAYRLSATNGEREVTALQEVTVNPAPTPTPLPVAPTIEFFTASPADVFFGSPESQNITLSWSIRGNTTNVEISGPDYGTASGLPRTGTRLVSANQSTLFILTAFNGALNASQTVQVQVTLPVPRITGVSPASAPVGSGDVTLTITGSSFVSSSTARWEGTNRPTTYVSGSELRVVIPSSDLTTSGTFNLSVFNPAPGGGSSGAFPFRVLYPVPVIGNISPGSVTAGNPDFVLIVNGSGFVQGSAVQWDGTNRVTSFVNGSQVTAQISAGDVSAAGTVSVTVMNPTSALGGGGLSNTVPFTINATNLAPALTSLSPNTALAGSTSNITLTVTGTNFVVGSVVQWNGLPLNTFYSSDTRLTAHVPSTNFASAGTYNVSVYNPPPGGGTSATLPFTVTNPIPSIGAGGLSPASAVAGSPAFTLTVSGTNFVSGSQVLWSGSPRETTFVNSTRLEAKVLASDVGSATPSTASISVLNAGAPPSNALTFNILPLNLTFSLPATMPLGGSATGTLTLSAVQAATRAIQLTSSNAAVAAVPPSVPIAVGTTGPVSFTVTSGGTGGVATITATLPSGLGSPVVRTISVANPAPTISVLSPPSAIAGGQPFTLTVSGSGFVSTSEVRWNGSPRLTRFVNSTRLEASIPASDIANVSPGSASVTVFNPTAGGGGGTSSPLTFTINAPTLTLSPPSVVLSGTIPMQVSMNTVMAADTVVTLTPPPGVATTSPAGSVTILAGSATASFDAVPVGQGSGTITATLPASLGGGFATSTITVNTPVPSITSLSPPTTIVGSGSVALTIDGAGFVDGTSAVQANGTNLGLGAVVSPTRLTTTLPATMTTVAAALNITVANGSLLSNSRPFTVTNPVPSINSLTPSTVEAGGDDLPLTIDGTGFLAGVTSVQADGTDLGLGNVINGTQLTTTIPASFIATAGTVAITVSNPQPGGGTSVSNVQNLTVTNPSISLLPSTLTLDLNASATMTVTISSPQNGPRTISLAAPPNVTTNPAGSVVMPSGSTTVTFTVTGVLAGTGTLTATLPASLGSGSDTSSITVLNPTPTINPGGLSPSSATAGGLTFTLTVNGTNFVNGAQVQWNGGSRSTSFVNGSQLQATIPASDIASVGSASVTVVNPSPCNGSCTSNSQTFTINNLTIVSFIPISVSVPIGGSTTMTVTVSAPQNNTPVSLSVSNPGIISLPGASPVISGGATSVSFSITGVTTGTTIITATLPLATGGDARSADVTVP